MLKCDIKLVKATLEYNNFIPGEGPNFSVCWLGNLNN